MAKKCVMLVETGKRPWHQSLLMSLLFKEEILHQSELLMMTTPL